MDGGKWGGWVSCNILYIYYYNKIDVGLCGSMLNGGSVFVISWVKLSSPPFVQEELLVVTLLLTLISQFGGVRQLVGDFLLYKVTGEVVEVARWIHRSSPSYCFVSLTQGTLFLFLCFLSLGNTPHPTRFGIYTPSSLAFFVSLF